MKRNYDSLTCVSKHQDKWLKWRKDLLRLCLWENLVHGPTSDETSHRRTMGLGSTGQIARGGSITSRDISVSSSSSSSAAMYQLTSVAPDTNMTSPVSQPVPMENCQSCTRESVLADSPARLTRSARLRSRRAQSVTR